MTIRTTMVSAFAAAATAGCMSVGYLPPRSDVFTSVDQNILGCTVFLIPRGTGLDKYHARDYVGHHLDHTCVVLGPTPEKVVVPASGSFVTIPVPIPVPVQPERPYWDRGYGCSWYHPC